MPLRVLLINPNTTAAITSRIVAAAAAFAPGVDCIGATGRFGATYISSRAAYAIAGHAALDAWANAEGPFDAVVIACFGDPGLDALREIASAPVIGMADASLHVAMQVSRRFSVITGGKRWESMLLDFARSRGVEGCIASIRTVAPTGAALSVDPERAVTLLRASCRQCVEEDGAEAVIVGGAGLVAFSAEIQAECPVPVIDSLQAALTMATALAPLHAALRQKAGVRDPNTSLECIGIPRALAEAISRLG